MEWHSPTSRGGKIGSTPRTSSAERGWLHYPAHTTDYHAVSTHGRRGSLVLSETHLAAVLVKLFK